jgi:hypothetical protein
MTKIYPVTPVIVEITTNKYRTKLLQFNQCREFHEIIDDFTYLSIIFR